MKVVATSVSPTQLPILLTGFLRVACVEFGRHIELGVTFRRCVSSKPAYPVGPTGVAREHVIVMGWDGAVDHVVSWSCTVARSTVSIAAPSVSPDASLRATRSRDRLLHAAQRHPAAGAVATGGTKANTICLRCLATHGGGERGNAE